MVPRPVFTEYSKPAVTLPETSELCSGNKEELDDLFISYKVFILKVLSCKAFGTSVCHAHSVNGMT